MKKLISLVIVIYLLSGGLIRSQALDYSASQTLEKLFQRLKSASDDGVRVMINDSIKVIIENFAKSDSVFSRNFRDVRYLGQITSSDSLIKIITWNLVLDNDQGSYFCYLVRRTVNGVPNTIYDLTRKYEPEPITSDTIYTRTDWYGALYYDIKPFTPDGRKCWVLLGINFSDPLVTRKVIDVLSFTPANNIILGKRLFNTGKGINYRHVLEYSSSGVISLRFTSANSIVFDHLVPVPSMVNNGRIYYGSDYSSDAFIFRDGFWNLTLNVDARNKKK